jgi:perosamine synthetase
MGDWRRAAMRDHGEPIMIAAPQIGAEEREAVDRVLRSASLAQGAEVAAFESEFSDLVEGRHCIAVNSGTSALHLGMVAAGLGPGDEVIVPSFTFAATANAVALTGATPIFVDIDPDDYCISPDAVRAAISPRTAGIAPVHLFGQVADIPRINELADRHGLAVFEDACQAHTARLGATPAGAFGTMAAFSFYPTKNMTTGEGGLIVTTDEAIARRARLLRNQGMEKRYANEIVGFNARMTEPAAAMGRVQLRRLGQFTQARQANAAYLDEHLEGVTTPQTRHGNVHVYHQYTVRSSDRDGLAETLASHGVGTGVYYPTPVHRLPAYALDLELPNTTVACEEVLSLPVHPGLSRSDLERIVLTVRAHNAERAVRV